MGSWKPYGFNRDMGPKISHLFFADDILLVAEATLAQVDEVKRILEVYCNYSGQKVNLQKSAVNFSNNVKNDIVDTLSNVLGMPYTKNIGNYLGIPIIHSRVQKKAYTYLVDKVRRKLTSWKARTLCFAGRVTLAQSTVMNLPSYVMQTTTILVSICDEVERLCRDFIWGSTESQ